jgi:tetratricopeptide (TPR) repeat protein
MKKIHVFLVLACAAAAVAQPQKAPSKQERDLKIEKEEEIPLPTGQTIPRSYAVIIGISRYGNLEEKFQLQYAERDAHSIHTALISQEGGNFKAENIRMLTGSQATLANIRREIDVWLPSVAKEDDRVLIYFAGHGFISENKGYLAPYDFDMKRISQSGYPMGDLGAIIGGKIKAKSKILLTDSCHSGAITPEDTEKVNQTLGTLQKSLFSLTASRDREQSFESGDLGGGHGVFTYYVNKGLSGEADITPRDGVVNADELAEYVRREVRQATGGRQNPTSDRGSFDPNMFLAWVPSNAPPASAPAPKTGGLVIEANMDGVEVFVDRKSAGVVSKGKSLSLPGLTPGMHTVMGVRMGYEPDGPREEMVYPGQDSTVTLKILIPRRRKQAALDELDKGIEFYQKGFEANYKKAAEHFEAALRIEPSYSHACYYLGLTYSALFDHAKGEQYYKKAIELDPDYLEARANYAGMLLDTGNVDEALRQVNTVLVRQPNHALALGMQAQAYRLKLMFPQAIDSARKAVKLAPKNAEPYLWMADSLRLSDKYAEAKTAYTSYLTLSDFDSKLAGKINYYAVGFLVGLGKKKRASSRDIWAELRSLAYFGLCDSERKLKNYDAAILHCTKSLQFDRNEPYAHYALGLSFMARANLKDSAAELQPALQHLQKTVELNPEMTEADYARKNIVAIQEALKVH